MSLTDKIKTHMYSAMKSGDKPRAGVLRNTLAKLKDKRIQKQDDLSESEEIRVIQGLVKQHQESITMYEKGARTDLVEAENAEMEILESYLPQMMKPDEIRTVIETVIAETGATSLSDIGKVMPLVMKQGAGRVDGKLAQSILRELLA